MSIEVDVGTPPEGYKEWTTALVRFHGFANLTTTSGEVVLSPEFSCFGLQWRLELYPGGRDNSDEGYVSIALVNKSNTSIKVKWGCSLRDANGKELVHHAPQTSEFAAQGSQAPLHSGWCNGNFARRSTIMSSLVNGSLVIDVRTKSTAADKSITQFIPSNPINKNVLELFMDEETADVVFEVDNVCCQSEGHTNKKTKSTSTFYVHRNILKKCAPTLYEMCGVVDRGEITTVSITDVSPEIFKHMIYYTYGGKLSKEDLEDNAKDIIDACDKYGVVHLKLEAEAAYVESTTITINNMMDNLLFADSKNLALLKEAVMDYIVANKGDIIGKVSFDNVPGGTVTDVLTAVARGEESGEGDSTDYNRMRVGTLRKMLDEKGLDVDGSREAMIALLKEDSA